MEKDNGGLEQRNRQLEETVRSLREQVVTLQDQVRRLGGSPSVLPIGNSISQRVQDVTSGPPAESLLQQIKNLNPDSFQSKEQAREHFIRLVVQYWNSVKPVIQSGFNAPGIQITKYPAPLIGIEIPISFFESKEVEGDYNPIKRVIVLPLFGVSPADITDTYESSRQGGDYSGIVRVLSPAMASAWIHSHVVSGAIKDRGSLRKGGLRHGSVE